MFHADETERNYNLFHKIYYNVEAVKIVYCWNKNSDSICS